MFSPISVKQIPLRSSLQLQLLRRIRQSWLPVNSTSTDPQIVLVTATISSSPEQRQACVAAQYLPG